MRAALLEAERRLVMVEAEMLAIQSPDQVLIRVDHRRRARLGGACLPRHPPLSQGPGHPGHGLHRGLALWRLPRLGGGEGIAVDLHPHCLDVARERLGATHTFLPPDAALAGKVMKATGGEGVYVGAIKVILSFDPPRPQAG